MASNYNNSSLNESIKKTNEMYTRMLSSLMSDIKSTESESKKIKIDFDGIRSGVVSTVNDVDGKLTLISPLYLVLARKLVIL